MTDGVNEYRSSLMAQPGALYRHFKGGLYVVLSILEPSNKKENETVTDHNNGIMVAYMNLETGKRYWRNLFGEDGFSIPKKHEDGTMEQRFTFCGYVEEIKIDTRGRYYVTHKY
jgi:hypothetical protein